MRRYFCASRYRDGKTQTQNQNDARHRNCHLPGYRGFRSAPHHIVSRILSQKAWHSVDSQRGVSPFVTGPNIHLRFPGFAKKSSLNRQLPG